MHIIEIDRGSAAYEQAKQLRDDVLRKPLGMRLSPKDIEGEESQWHMVAMADGAVEATLSLKPLPHAIMKFRQLVVDTNIQGSGLGRMMMEAGEALAKERGCTHAELHARVYAQPFYEKLGYLPTGEVFLEVGIPHIKMTKAIP